METEAEIETDGEMKYDYNLTSTPVEDIDLESCKVLLESIILLYFVYFAINNIFIIADLVFGVYTDSKNQSQIQGF